MMVHPLAREIADRFAAYLNHPELVEANVNPFARHDRSGWFHCSALNHKPPTMVYNPRNLVLEALGAQVAQQWNAVTAWAVGRGTFVDQVARAAMTASPLFMATQVRLVDRDLRLVGTPDFTADVVGDALIGDVKCVDSHVWRQHLANPTWDLSNAYFWRQLQAYLMLSHTERGILIAVNGGGPIYKQHETGDPDKPGLVDCFAVREFERDEVCIAGIRNDVERMLPYLDRCEALLANGAGEEALLRALPGA